MILELNEEDEAQGKFWKWFLRDCWYDAGMRDFRDAVAVSRVVSSVPRMIAEELEP